ncbi:unnamed protein product [Linum tenue]|uniref:Uncharacterized protein n=1 Tax=Linum tenue TaxID=586396 RepID=A0AAV0RRY8_9ROSI|nr:unnamed protein product [Linum tenue]
MMRDVSSFSTYNYGDALYWDARYVEEAGSFDWYQRYSSLRPFVRHYVPTSSRVLMVGCGNARNSLSPAPLPLYLLLRFSWYKNLLIAYFRFICFCLLVMSEDMVKDGYEDIMNIDISSVAIEMMSKKYEYIPQLKYMKMDVRDMSAFADDSFGSVIDKGTLDSLMCGNDAPISAAQMLGEITYGDPKVRMPHLMRPVYNWKIMLYIIPRPGFHKPAPGSSSSSCAYLEPVPITENGLLPVDYVLQDPDSHFIYICKKMDENSELNEDSSSYPLRVDKSL